MKIAPIKSKRSDSSPTRRIVILGVPPVIALDVAGPAEVFSTVNILRGSGGKAYEIQLASGGDGRLIESVSGVSMIADFHYSEIRGKVHTLLIAGGRGVLNVRDRALLRWLRRRATEVRRLGSVCTGAFLLAEAGLLDGRRATTHWHWAADLASRYSKVTVDASPIWVRDGNVYTSAGASAGIDLSLALVEEDFGSRMALEAARALVVFLRRPGGQAQFSVSLSAQTAERRPLAELKVWMAEHLNSDLSVEALASRVAMSPRNFARVFAKEMGRTPARYVEQLRLEAARRALETSDRSLDEVASACGFGSVEIMRRAFHRSFHSPPGRYRSLFRSSSVA